MAKKISQLLNIENLVGTELLLVLSEGRNYKVTFQNIKESFDKGDLGLDDVDNTSDQDKPISLATQFALDLKSEKGHTHVFGEVEGIVQYVSNYVDGYTSNYVINYIDDNIIPVLNGKAETVHSHDYDDIPGLRSELDNKALALHIHQINEIPGLSAILVNKAELVHNHAISEVTGLVDILDEINLILDTTVTQSTVNSAVVNAINGANLVNQTQLGAAVSNLNLSIAGKADLLHNHVSDHITDLLPVVEGMVSDLGLGIGDVNVVDPEW